MRCASNGHPRTAHYTQRAIEFYFIMSASRCPFIVNIMMQHFEVRVIGKLNYSPPSMRFIAMQIQPYVHMSG